MIGWRGLQPRCIRCGVHLKQPGCVEQRVHQRFHTASNWWHGVILDDLTVEDVKRFGDLMMRPLKKYHFVKYHSYCWRSISSSFLGHPPALNVSCSTPPAALTLQLQGCRIWCRMVRVCLHMYTYVDVFYII